MIFYFISALFIFVLLVTSILYIKLSIDEQKKNPEIQKRKLRCFVRNNLNIYGVSSHGNSMDDVKIYNIKPNDLGV